MSGGNYSLFHDSPITMGHLLMFAIIVGILVGMVWLIKDTPEVAEKKRRAQHEKLVAEMLEKNRNLDK